MAKSLYVILNSKGKLDRIERDPFNGQSLPRLHSTLKSARYSLSKYCENIGGRLVYECGSIAKAKLVIESPAKCKR